ncbi:hypothetical protein EDB86DRAFT_3065599 [Lactarius hatsudake]|nr:hypothetical protein EDB86DRAFT_3065599 [Lactarius hatsudake]
MADDAGVERGEDDECLMLDEIFPEPPRPPSPEPTIAVYESGVSDTGTPRPWSTITVRLVGSHPLWGHYLWNAARALARYLERTPTLYRGLNVLELGAGAGLPGLVVAKSGARHNGVAHVVAVLGYVWGRPVEPLSARGAKFDLIILSDLIFNHSQHRELLWTCERAVAPRGCVLVFFTHHRPPLAQRDMAFFDMARETGWACEKVLTERFAEVRSTVHGWKLTRVPGGD